MKRILIADDNAMVRRGLRGLIASNEDWQVCGEPEVQVLLCTVQLSRDSTVGLAIRDRPETHGLRTVGRLEPGKKWQTILPTEQVFNLLALP